MQHAPRRRGRAPSSLPRGGTPAHGTHASMAAASAQQHPAPRLQQLGALAQRHPWDPLLPVGLRAEGRRQRLQQLPRPPLLHLLRPEADAQHAACAGAVAGKRHQMRRECSVNEAARSAPLLLLPLLPPVQHSIAPPAQALHGPQPATPGPTRRQRPRPVGQHGGWLGHLLQAKHADHARKRRQLIQPAGIAHPAGEAQAGARTWVGAGARRGRRARPARRVRRAAWQAAQEGTQRPLQQNSRDQLLTTGDCMQRRPCCCHLLTTRWPMHRPMPT